jgi:putative endopeptidase
MGWRRLLSLRLAPWLMLGCLSVGAAWGQGQPPLAKPFFEPFGLDLSALDGHTRPQDDFYQYVNGAWIARTQIPADKDQLEETGNRMQERVDARIRALLETAAGELRGPATTPEQKAGAMYAAFMDATRINALGDVPIEPELKAVRSAPDRVALARIMGQSFAELGGSIFAASINIDFSDPAHYAVYLNQAGLGMPDRRYYLLADFSRERRAYQSYVLRLLELIRWPDPVASADAVVRFESRIAEASWSAAEQRDAVKSFNPMSTAELAAFARGFPWKEFLAGAQLGDKKRVIVGEKSAFPKIAAVFAATPVETLKAWCAFNVADRAAPYLPSPFGTARFEFRGKALEGRVKMPPRWRRGVLAVSGGDCIQDASMCFGTLGFLVGQMYVEHYFQGQTKAKVEALVSELKSAYRQRIERLPWMSATTKQEALRKLAGYNVKVGFPEHPRDYSSVDVRSDDLVGDVRRAAAGDWKRLVGRSTGPVDWSDWLIPPQVSDAYNGYLNDVVFPAAGLEPPIFDPAADDAVNYGSVGFLVGHELTHGFDDQGRSFDATGALRDWWTTEDADSFNARADKLGAQYVRYEVVPGVHIDPGLTMGENIADLGGLLIALDAYHASLRGKPAPVIGGFTGDQRLLMSFAQAFRAKVRPEMLRKAALNDVHSADRFRVLGVLPNVDGWYEAFDVKPGDRMYRAPEERVRIW